MRSDVVALNECAPARDFSLQVTAVLRQAGFDDVRSMAGGIHLWSLDIDPSVAVY